jgi:acyl-coenzyme A synthetase/AMP-(fatty) acid ligase
MKADCDPNNIGFAIGTHLWVVERGNYNSLAPIGCPGELLISGPTLARGYFKDEARTQAAFIDGGQYPWVKAGEERLYATGDIVTRNTYIGRRDLQVKLNGFRIELGEIEYNLEQCPAVVSAVVDKVTAREGGSDQLVAFLGITQQAQLDNGSPLLPPSSAICDIIEGVQARIDGALPPYMVPRVYLPLARIPLTLSKKTDRKALQNLWAKLTPKQILPYQAAPAVLRPPASVTERILQGLWAQVLKIDPKLIGLDTQFTRVGGISSRHRPGVLVS